MFDARLRPVLLRLTRGHVRAAVAFAAFVGCNSGCMRGFGDGGSGDCAERWYGGGEFSIALTGDLQATIGGAGSTRREIEDWVAREGSWGDLAGRYEGDGATIATYGEPLTQDPTAGFAASVELERGDVRGCEAATFAGVFVGREFAWLELLDENAVVVERPEFGRAAGSYEGGPMGSGSFTISDVAGACAQADEFSVTVDVSWQTDPEVVVESSVDCSGGWFGG